MERNHIPAPRVRFAVVSFNTRMLLERCLRALDGEVWVVDNASLDGSADLVREAFPDVRLIAREDNLGFGRAINLIAAQPGEWEWLAIANADTAPEPGAVHALLRAGEGDPGAGALAPRLILPSGDTQHSVHPFWTLGFGLAYNFGARGSRRFGERHALAAHWDPDRPRRVGWAIGAFLLVRREAWVAVGGFDEKQWLYAEDVELGWRLRQAGWATRYVPQARVSHAESASIGPLWGDAKTQRWMAAAYHAMLRREPVRARLFAAASVVGDLGRYARTRDPEFRRWAALHSVGLRPRSEIERRLPTPP